MLTSVQQVVQSEERLEMTGGEIQWSTALPLLTRVQSIELRSNWGLTEAGSFAHSFPNGILDEFNQMNRDSPSCTITMWAVSVVCDALTMKPDPLHAASHHFTWQPGNCAQPHCHRNKVLARLFQFAFLCCSCGTVRVLHLMHIGCNL